MANSRMMRVDADFERFLNEVSRELGISRTELTRQMINGRRKGKKFKMLWDEIKI